MVDTGRKFWTARPHHLISSIGDTKSEVAAIEARRQHDHNNTIAEREQFFKQNKLTEPNGLDAQQPTENAISENLHFWMKYNSWTFCPSCGSITMTKPLPNFEKRPANKCEKNVYIKSHLPMLSQKLMTYQWS